MGLQRFERRLERLVEGAFSEGISQRPPARRDRTADRPRDGRGPHARRARHGGAESLHRRLSRPTTTNASRGFHDALVQRARRSCPRARPRRALPASKGPSTVELDRDDSARKRRSPRATPRSSQGTAGPIGTLVLPDGRRIALGDADRDHRPPSRLCDRALRSAGLTPPRRGPPRRAGLPGRRPRLHQRHARERRRWCTSSRSHDGDVIMRRCNVPPLRGVVSGRCPTRCSRS